MASSGQTSAPAGATAAPPPPPPPPSAPEPSRGFSHGRRRVPRCHRCTQRGHMARNCPQNRVQGLLNSMLQTNAAVLQATLDTMSGPGRLGNHQNSRNSWATADNPPPPPPSQAAPVSGPTQRQAPRCHRRNRRGHTANECRRPEPFGGYSARQQ